MDSNLVTVRHLRAASQESAERAGEVAAAAAAAIEELRDIIGIPVFCEPTTPEEVYAATRPADWLTMPEPEDNEIYLLVHVPAGGIELLAFTVECVNPESDYTVEVDYGVSTVSRSLSSGSVYETVLDANDIANGTLTADGDKQVLVRVYADGIRSWEPAEHSRRRDFRGWRIVEMSCRLPQAVSVKVSYGVYKYKNLNHLRYFYWPGENQITNMTDFFRFCYSLRTVRALDASHAATLDFMFADCYSLQAIPALNFPAATLARHTFKNCHNLRSIPPLDISQIIDAQHMFEGCSRLETVQALDTRLNYRFDYMFASCHCLRSVPPLDTSSAISIDHMFCDAHLLRSVSGLDFTNITEEDLTADAFKNCFSLASLTMNPDAEDSQLLSIADCALEHDALCVLLESLPDISGVDYDCTLTLRGNPGVPELTNEEKAIAADKGWRLIL